MIDLHALAACLRSLDLEDWQDTIATQVESRLSPKGHGDFQRWQAIIEGLPDARNNPGALKELLLGLSPWRKGPFDVGGVHIDTEWRSDLKWARVKDAIEPLEGRAVLDVGCGNGYYALQMRNAGARVVVGVDPTLLFVMQFLAVNFFTRCHDVFVLPMRLQELALPAKVFDTTFSMGVLYHQREPLDHLTELRQTLRPGGQLVLETLYLPGEETRAWTPPDRYARMRNVWLLPTLSELRAWLHRSGYANISILDQSVTSIDEQRSTEWMTFDSLSEALDPNDPTRTVEGWPAPHRVVVTATSA